MKEIVFCKQFNVYIFEFFQLCCFCERCMFSDISMNFGYGYSGKIVKKLCLFFYNISVVFKIRLCDKFLLY